MKRLRFLPFILSFSILSACGSSGPSGPNPVVVMETSMGAVKIELFQEKAPNTVENFLKYVDQKHYDNTVFHRVIPDFMIQGGGFEPGALQKDREKPTMPPIRNESSNGLTNERGTLAMARTGEPHSATSQFFINVKKNDFLDRARAQDRVGYCVFGKVIEGMDIVDEIRTVQTGRVGPHDDVPLKDVLIKSIRRVEPKADAKTPKGEN
jgi:cyclophilin family peptidyl-prolyl cis-trans isomerase